MKISGIAFTHSSYKTTNPPVSTFSETLICERPEGGFSLKVTNEYNSAKSVREYSVTAEQFDEIVSLFVSLGVKDAVNALKAKENTGFFPQMVGGSESFSFSFTEDGVTVCVNCILPEAQPLTARIASLEKECGKPVSEHEEGFESNVFAGAPAPAGFASPLPVTADTAMAEGEWICKSCGSKNIRGKFCCECGTIHTS